ncbi:MAG: nicotinate (nicotinamide) nucleotide adenylyltransferase [Gemmatimonadota bacterium]
MTGRRIGVFGGAFDPPHIGHLVAAQDVFEALHLDLLLVIPSARPPHRKATLEAEDRLSLVRTAFGGDPRIEVSDIELRRSGPSWTVDTLREIRDRRQPCELVLVIGVDQYRTFESWRDPDTILQLAELAVMPREGEFPMRDPRYPFVEAPVTRVDVSSTRVRDRLSLGLTVRYLVPGSIRERLEEIWSGSGINANGPAPTLPTDLEKDAMDRC